MRRYLGAFAMAAPLLLSLAATAPAMAQRAGGILKVHQWDNPPSLSIHEEVTIATIVPMMGLFNNLVMYDQHEPQNSLRSIIPDLATAWSWNEDGTVLRFALRNGVTWHDGHPFTANDVKCTWDLLLGKSQEKLRTNPRKAWYYKVVCAKFSKLVMAGGLAEPGSKLASLCSIGQTHPFVPTCLPAERRAQPRSRLAVGHRRRRRAAVWTAASTVPS